MRLQFVRGILPLQAITILLFPASAAFSESSTRTEVYKEIDGVTLTVKVFLPDRAVYPAPNPGIVFFFGGGWRQGSMTQFEPFAEHYASLGMAAAVADYRVASRHGVTPIECIADARSAVRWFRAHSEEYGLDANRIAASGGSAGGHLAACTALVWEFDETAEAQTASATPDALILFNPRMNLEGIRRRLDLGESHLLASPYHQLESDLPPTLILHGVDDKTVPISDPREFRDKAAALGLPCELAEFEGEGHGFFNARRPENFRAALSRVDEFLRSLDWIR